MLIWLEKNIPKGLILFIIGGFLYITIELFYQQRTDISMFFAGGICFVLVGLLNESHKIKIGVFWQMIIAACLITTVEFAIGMIENIWLQKRVWDYSGLPFNVKGQICLLYAGFWFLLSFPAILLDDWIRYKLWQEEKPRYKLF